MFYFAVLTHNRSFNKSKREEPHEVARATVRVAYAVVVNGSDIFV